VIESSYITVTAWLALANVCVVIFVAYLCHFFLSLLSRFTMNKDVYNIRAIHLR